ncbi:MAG: aspartate--tRNA ligase [Alphaproteobacteria bacterium]|nr:aspartate--tRNA ligase [Rickettsiales bacterium]
MTTKHLATKLRDCTCNDVTIAKIGKKITICGWLMSKRNHGGVIFADVRDHYGIVQIAIDIQNKEDKRILSNKVSKTTLESVISVTGEVKKRDKGTERTDNPTGEIEIDVEKFSILSLASNELPLPIDNNSPESNDTVRLANRFLDLRRKKMQKIMDVRGKVLSFLREKMIADSFKEIQTPILTAPTPEGATDYLVPSRIMPAHYYALPQSPQLFKQLLMVSGIDRYFQIAPCFRNEDARADRTVGEFYQLDAEMSFVEQDDVLQTMELIVQKLFEAFKPNTHKQSYLQPLPKIQHAEAMVKYGSDKPDLRIPLENKDLTETFKKSGFGIFKNAIAKGAIVISILAPKASSKSRSFFDSKIDFAKSLGGGGLAYIKFEEDGTPNSPIVKLLTKEELSAIKQQTSAQNGDVVFFACEHAKLAYMLAGEIRLLLGRELELIEKNTFKLCWIVDFPMFEIDYEKNSVSFSHNPFSKAKKTLSSLNIGKAMQENKQIDIQTLKELEQITCHQYDIVCNGYEIGSGGIRNANPEEMTEAFKICGVDITQFSAMYKAFTQAGAPPHGGIALGIERILMILCETTNIKDVIAFPLNSNGIDMLMEAPRMLSEKDKNKSFSEDYTKLSIQDQLSYACQNNNTELAKTTIKKEVNINYHDAQGRTPLIIAIRAKSLNVLEYFFTTENIKKQLDLFAKDNIGYTVAKYTVINGVSSFAKKLLQIIKTNCDQEVYNKFAEAINAITNK